MRGNNYINLSGRRNTTSGYLYAITVNILLAAFVGLCMMTVTPQAVHASTTITITPAADAILKASSGGSNYGNTTPLSVQGNELRITYMKFDLSSLAGKTITSAKLRLTTVSDGGSSALQIIKFVSDSSWSESSITYNNSYNGSNSNLKPSTQIGSMSGGASSSTIETILNTSTVAANAGKLFSIALLPASLSNTDDLKFNSKESSSNKPVLVIVYDSTSVTNTPTRTPTKAATTSTPTRTPTRTPTKAPTTGTPTRTPTRTPTQGAGTPTKTPTPIKPTITPTFGACSTTTVPNNLTPHGQLAVAAAGLYRFTWDTQTGATKYALRIDDLQDNFSFNYISGVCTPTNAGDVCMDDLTNNTFEYKVTPGHTYKWWVHAINSCNAWSPAASVDLSVVTQPAASDTPTPTAVVTVPASPTDTPPVPSGPTGVACPAHSKGDANCDGQVDFIDFEIWRQESMGEASTKQADFNDDTVVDFVDFEIWRQGYFDEAPPVATPTAVACLPKPLCSAANNQCADLTPPAEGWCPIEVTGIPTPTCVQRPSCLDSEPRCLIAEPAEGWCATVPEATPTLFR